MRRGGVEVAPALTRVRQTASWAQRFMTDTTFYALYALATLIVIAVACWLDRRAERRRQR